MKILFVASEASPLAKVGGLADVIGSLPAALARLGHEVRVMMPLYDCIDVKRYPLTPLLEGLRAPMMGQIEAATLATARWDGVTVYLVGNRRYFGNPEVYSSDDLRRFLFFSRAVYEALPRLDWQPDIVHCHDWHTALAVMWLKKSHAAPALVFTIHNLAYQGIFDAAFLAESGLARDWTDCPPDTPKPTYNFMCQGILCADLVTTVSETYAREILTRERGAGLDRVLRHRQSDLLGIVNGLDYSEYDPSTDPSLQARYDWSTLGSRVVNKLAIQRELELPPSADTPLIGMVQRLEEQKGFDILEGALPAVLETGAQIAILGQGQERYANMLRQAAERYPQQVAVCTTFNDPLAHRIYGGCDLFLMPSRYEPCGLGQLIAMRYGALPVVRHTGGLVDTVPEFTPDLGQGSGFVFREYSSEALARAVRWSVDAFRNKSNWRQAVQRVMRLDFSWRPSAAKYVAAYRRALAAKGNR